MTNVQTIASVSVSLTAAPASTVSFGVPLLLVDHADVPVHARYREVTKADYATELTASTEQANWCAAFWGTPNHNPEKALIGRWALAATESYAYCPNATQVASVYAALTSTAQLGVL